MEGTWAVARTLGANSRSQKGSGDSVFGKGNECTNESDEQCQE